MDNLFASGVIIEAILGLMLFEGIALLILRAAGRRGLAAPEVLTSLGAGAALMLALRAALMGSGWPSIAVWLLVALVAHGSDVVLRWRVHED